VQGGGNPAAPQKKEHRKGGGRKKTVEASGEKKVGGEKRGKLLRRGNPRHLWKEPDNLMLANKHNLKKKKGSNRKEAGRNLREKQGVCFGKRK